MTLREADQHLRQWTNLHGRAVESWRLDPRIFLVAIPAREVGVGHSFIRMERFVAVIVGVRNILADAIAKIFIGCGLEGMHAADISVHDVAAGKIIGCARAVERQVGDRKVIVNALADLNHSGYMPAMAQTSTK